jgi:hypothetical protein
MSFQLSKFTLRVDSELLNKFRYVADYNARSTNRELEVVMKKYGNEFEKKYGMIEINNIFIGVILPSYKCLAVIKTL